MSLSEHILFTLAGTLIYEGRIHRAQRVGLKHSASQIRGREQILANKSDKGHMGCRKETIRPGPGDQGREMGCKDTLEGWKVMPVAPEEVV